MVERTHSWLNRFRKLLVSFEKAEDGYGALLTLAAAMICWRQTILIYGYALSKNASSGEYNPAFKSIVRRCTGVVICLRINTESTVHSGVAQRSISHSAG